MGGAVPPLLNTPSWHGAQEEHRNLNGRDHLEDLGIDGITL